MLPLRSLRLGTRLFPRRGKLFSIAWKKRKILFHGVENGVFLGTQKTGRRSRKTPKNGQKHRKIAVFGLVFGIFRPETHEMTVPPAQASAT
ncbi:MAG: hypothetical protein GX803_06125 [Lentisphaerae bacterium]|jgi:hypothetical protein|nr:hypothetical protein [Lentisphaerota bacterium]